MADKEDKTPELEPVGPGAEMEPEDQTIRDVDGEDIRDDREDEHDRQAELEERDHQEDERAGSSEDDDEDSEGGDRERIRARRRAERRQKKEESRRNQRELNFLRQRNETLERRQSEFDARIANSEVTAVDTRIQSLENDIRKADEVYAEAISKGDGASAAEAQRIRDQLRDGVSKLQGHRQGIINSARERLQGSQNKPDPEIARRAQEFMADNPWYDHNGGDEDSMIAKVIEQRLYKERGPEAAKTDDYWREYDRRLRKRLPHVFERNGRDREDDRDDDRDDRYEETDDRDIDEHNRRAARSRRESDDRDERPTKKKGGGPRFTSGGRERPLKKNEVYVSEERRKAMEEAGVWDDPVLRNRYLKSYQNYDAAARRDRR